MAAATTGRGAAANKRADAQRNRAAILAATPAALRADPDASVADIAAAAGVGRMTLYGHFKTRAELIETALTESLEHGEEVLSEVPLDGDPAAAFTLLVETTWPLVDQARALLVAAQKELPSDRIRELHARAEARMRGLLERGRAEGVFRRDLPVRWMLAVTHTVINTAALEVSADRLTADAAAALLTATLLPAFTAS